MSRHTLRSDLRMTLGVTLRAGLLAGDSGAVNVEQLFTWRRKHTRLHEVQSPAVPRLAIELAGYALTLHRRGFHQLMREVMEGSGRRCASRRVVGTSRM